MVNLVDKTQIHMLVVNRYEDDILMRDELDRLSVEHFMRFTLTCTPMARGWDRELSTG